MKALLIVGHAYSDYQSVENILSQHGMSQAKQSRRELLSPSEISQKLLKAHDIVFSNNIAIEQIDMADEEVWNALSLDLLLANIEQDCWGWADPQTVFLLNYWRKIAPQLKFLLVYDTPEAICSAIFKDKQISQQEVEQEINHWNDFYEQLLYFYHRNQQHCLLVHSEQIKENVPAFMEAVAECIEYDFTDIDTSVDITTVSNKADQLLVTALLKEFPSIHTSYDALQAAADMPLADKEDQLSTIDSAVLAWNSRQEVTSVQPHQQSEELEQENELLLLQLHQVQEELEHYFLENQKLQSGNGSSSTSMTSSSPSFYNTSYESGSSSFHYGAADRIKRQLSYRLGATMIQQSRTVSGALMMPWALIKETREFRKDFKMMKDEKLPSINDYQDAYEAERVKQHLSYRLGHTLVKNANSVIGWIKLPWLLKQEIVDFQKRRGD